MGIKWEGGESGLLIRGGFVTVGCMSFFEGGVDIFGGRGGVGLGVYRCGCDFDLLYSVLYVLCEEHEAILPVLPTGY